MAARTRISSRSLLTKASLQKLGAWLVELALISYRDHAPHCYYSEGPKPDPLFETAARWGLNAEVIKAAVTDQTKKVRWKAEGRKKPAAK